MNEQELKIKIKNLNKGDRFKHSSFDFELRVSDTDEDIIQTESMHPKTGEHIFFIGIELEDEVILINPKNNK